MKEDKLEQYIRKNRSEFDNDGPSDELWNKISDNLEKKAGRKIPWVRIAWQAAAAVLVFLTAWYMKDMMHGTSKSSAIAVRKNIYLHPVLKNVKQTETHVLQQTTYYANTAIENTSILKTQNTDTLPPELVEATQYYSAQIMQTRNLMKQCASYTNTIDKQVTVEFSQLDTDYSSLQSDLKENIDNREVLEAMILNYRMRLEILQDILQQMESTADCSGQLKGNKI